MLVKIYALAWLFAIAASAGLLAMFGATEVVLAVVGFTLSPLFFAGIVAVLPWQMDRHYARHTLADPRPSEKKRLHGKKSSATTHVARPIPIAAST